MINYFHRKKKSITAWMLLGFAVLLMVSFGLDARTGMSSGGANDVAMKVDGQEITHRMYLDRYEMMTEMYRRQFGASFSNFKKFLNVEQRTIDEIVEEVLEDRFARSLSLTAGDAHVQQQLSRIPYFQTQGLTQQSYKNFLAAQRMTAQEFERALRQQALRDQMQGLFKDLALPSTSELKTAYETENAKAEFEYIPYPATMFQSKVDVSDESKLKEYYDQNTEKYRNPKSVKYAYVAFPPADFAAKVSVSEEDLKDLYGKKTRELTQPRELHLRHILLKRPKQEKSELEKLVAGGKDAEKPADVAALDKQKKEAIKSLQEKAQAGASFADLAKESSEDVVTKDAGGDLGWKPVTQLEKEVKGAVAHLEKGGVSDVITTPDKYEIFYVEEAKEELVKPFDSVREQLTTELKASFAPEYARIEAENFINAFRDASSGKEKEMTLEKFAESKGKKAVVTEKLLTKLVDPDGAHGLTAKVLPMQAGESNALRGGDIDYAVSVLESKESWVPEFASIKDKVTADYKARESVRLAKEAAQAAIKKLKELDPKTDINSAFAAAATALGTQVKKTEAITKTTETKDELFSSPETKRDAFGLSLDRPLPDKPANGSNTFYVYRLVKRTLPAPEEVEKGLAEYRKKETEKAQGRMFSYVMETMKASTDIWIGPDIREKASPSQEL